MIYVVRLSLALHVLVSNTLAFKELVEVNMNSFRHYGASQQLRREDEPKSKGLPFAGKHDMQFSQNSGVVLTELDAGTSVARPFMPGFSEIEELVKNPLGHTAPGGTESQGMFFLRRSAISIIALVLGGMCYYSQRLAPISSHLIFFGAQSFMNLYMKMTLSQVKLTVDGTMQGIPAPYLLTASQQCVSFLLLLVLIPISFMTPWKFKPTPVTTPRGWATLLLLALCFTFNISLNNLSLSMLPLSVNLVIRSCAPLTVLCLDRVFGTQSNGTSTDTFIMTFGTLCAALVVVAKMHSGTTLETGDSVHTSLGAFICTCSLIAASIELMVVRSAGSTLKLNPIDLVFYMPIPVAIMLAGPIYFIPHPVSWAENGMLTDAQIFWHVWKISPASLVLLALSGILALGYNGLLYSIVQKISPAYASYTSNFNKVATISLSLLFGLEHMPQNYWAAFFGLGILGNIGAFTFTSARKAAMSQSAGREKGEEQPQQ